MQREPDKAAYRLAELRRRYHHMTNMFRRTAEDVAYMNQLSERIAELERNADAPIQP